MNPVHVLQIHGTADTVIAYEGGNFRSGGRHPGAREDVEAWAAAIQDLAESAERRRELGAAARARAEEFTWERVGAARRSELARRVNDRR
jgi:glycosyltransferase involved in cell wall biosynthesis